MSEKQLGNLMDTQDMGLTIALVCAGHNLHELEKGINNRVTFRFTDDTKIDQHAHDYWNGDFVVDAKSYWNESKNLKTRLYSL